MVNLYLGIIYQRKRFIYNNDFIIVYKPIDYGLCEFTDTKYFHFSSGKYKGENIPNLRTTSDEICAALFNLEKIISSHFSDIDKYYEETTKNYYFLYDYNNLLFKTIGDKDLIEKCREVFGDNIQNKNITEEKESLDELNKIAEELFDDNEEEPENSFLIYDIEDKYKVLKEHILGQDEQLKQVLSCVVFNIGLAESGLSSEMVANTKTCILLLGNTGVGKTLMIKNISKLFNIPYVIEDATRYSATSWSGEDIENMIRNLYVASGKNKTNAEMGILVIDEFDKLCRKSENHKQATIAVQDGLLKIIEGTKMTISKTNHTDIGGFEFDTSKLTIILSGAFDGIDKIIEKRTNERKIGFNSQSSLDIIEESIQVEDLIEYGVKKELAGRMNSIIELNNPSKEDLKNAFLYSKDSPLNSLEKILKSNGIKIEFDEAFVEAVVNKAITLKTGYRGLNKVFNDIVNEERYDIVAGKKKVLSLTSEKVK